MKLLVGILWLALPFCCFSQGAYVAPEEVAPNGPTVKQYNFLTFPTFKAVPDPGELARMTEGDFQNHPEYGLVPYRTQCKDCIELLDKRTLDSRYFVKSGTEGQTFYVQQIYGQLHYEDEAGFLRTIDPRLRPLSANGMYGAPDQVVPTYYNHLSGTTMIGKDGHQLAYNGKTHLKADVNGSLIDLGALNSQDFRGGEDGVKTLEAWPGIDRLQIFKESGVKTNFILKAPPNLPHGAEWMVIEDRFNLPPGFSLVPDQHQGSMTSEGYWMGDLSILDAEGSSAFHIKRAVITDANTSKYGRVDLLDDPTKTVVAYDYRIDGEEVILSIRVAADWLNHPGRIYPVTVDPLVTGSATYSAGIQGLRYDATCWNDVNYCSSSMTVNVPGQSTLTDAFLDAQYVSEVFGCGIFVDCWMSEAAFRVVGPCGNSPPTPFYWTCLSPGGDFAGTCSGVGNPAGSTVTCVPPQCANYALNFEMRSYYCFCSATGCPTACQFMPNNSWMMTVEARTIESASTANSTPVTFTGSCNVPLNVEAVPSFGVPSYSFNWNQGPTPSNPVQTVSHGTNGTFSYICTVTDACGQTSLTTVNVVVNDCPLPVEWAHFSGKAAESTNILDWSTAVELQVDHFQVERSVVGGDYLQIGRVESQQSGGNAQYTFEDSWPLASAHYRIKSLDVNGAFQYSEAILINRDPREEVLQLAYDPHSMVVTASWTGMSQTKGKISLYTVDAKEVAQADYVEGVGTAMQIQLPVGDLASGVYFLRWKGKNHKLFVR